MSVLVALIIAVLVFLILSFMFAAFFALLRVAVPLLLIWIIYLLVRRHREPESRHRTTYYHQSSRNDRTRGRKQARNAREIHDDDDSWSDF